MESVTFREMQGKFSLFPSEREILRSLHMMLPQENIFLSSYVNGKATVPGTAIFYITVIYVINRAKVQICWDRNTYDYRRILFLFWGLVLQNKDKSKLFWFSCHIIVCFPSIFLFFSLIILKWNPNGDSAPVISQNIALYSESCLLLFHFRKGRKQIMWVAGSWVCLYTMHTHIQQEYIWIIQAKKKKKKHPLK